MNEDSGYGTDDEQRPVYNGPIARCRSTTRTKSLGSDAPPPPPRAHPGINRVVLARMCSRSSEDDNDDDDNDDEEMLHNYGYNQYSNHNSSKPKRRVSASSGSRQARRHSTDSRASRNSQRSRSSFPHSRKTDPLKGLYPAVPKPDDSDLEDSSSSMDDHQQYEYEEFGYESDAAQSISARSMSSNRATRSRRNSCIILPGKSMIGGETTDNEKEEEEEDPLFNIARSKLEVEKKSSRSGINFEASEDELQPSKPQRQQEAMILSSTTLDNGSGNNNTPLPSGSVRVVKPDLPHDSSWKRKDPLTTSYASPTKDNLSAICGVVPVQKKSKGWGDMQLNIDGEMDCNDDEGSNQDPYGRSMYTKTTNYKEIDQYKQKVRRRASIENTCMSIPSPQADTVINFKPAEGCSNASDFIVRCFSARLRISGFTVLKHNRNRWSKAKCRVIYLLPDGKTLTWKEATDEDKEGTKKGDPIVAHANMRKERHPRIDLSTVREVRHAWSTDPNGKNKRGTAVLRSRCKDSGLAGKSFSLIFAKRTLDMTAFSNDQCKVLMEGFSALCFRLKQLKYEQSSHLCVGGESTREFEEDDWATSTVSGAWSTLESVRDSTTTGSIVKSDNHQTVSPWGL